MTIMRAWVGALVGVGIAWGIALACTTDYQKGVDDPLYGAPNALAGQSQPGSTSENTVKEAGAAGALKCGAQVDGGPCAVSFKTDILGTFKTACAGTSCHSGNPPPNKPMINPDDPTATWQSFVDYPNIAKAYINPCSTDDTQSAIACNLQGTAGCGAKMPLGTTYPGDIAKITAWQKCGAPNN